MEEVTVYGHPKKCNVTFGRGGYNDTYLAYTYTSMYMYKLSAKCMGKH